MYLPPDSGLVLDLLGLCMGSKEESYDLSMFSEYYGLFEKLAKPQTGHHFFKLPLSSLCGLKTQIFIFVPKGHGLLCSEIMSLG
jgi:hypothetical protein